MRAAAHREAPGLAPTRRNKSEGAMLSAPRSFFFLFNLSPLGALSTIHLTSALVTQLVLLSRVDGVLTLQRELQHCTRNSRDGYKGGGGVGIGRWEYKTRSIVCISRVVLI